MTTIAQAIAVSALTSGLTVSTFVLEHLGLKNLLDLNSSSANVVPLTEFPKPYFIRELWKDKTRVVNVFDSQGNQVYSIERLSGLTPVWSLLTFPERKEVATINTRFFARAIDFHYIKGVTHRDITSEYGLNGNFQSFQLNDGKYSWTRGSKFLEKVINPNGSSEEQRIRVAKVKLMRQFKLDFEMLIDETMIDREIALATGFVSILTQWGTGEITDTIGPTYIPPQEVVGPPQDPHEQKVVLVIENDLDASYEVEEMA